MNLNYSYRDWHTKYSGGGEATLHAQDGTLIARFADWQVADFVVLLLENQKANDELIEQKDERIAELEEEVVETSKDCNDLKEQSENDYRTILDLEKEIDELKTKLWNLSHE